MSFARLRDHRRAETRVSIFLRMHESVIRAAEGGLRETIVLERKGTLTETALTSDSVCEAVRQLDRLGPAATRADCEQQAARFDAVISITKMHAVLLESRVDQPMVDIPFACERAAPDEESRAPLPALGVPATRVNM